LITRALGTIAAVVAVGWLVWLLAVGSSSVPEVGEALTESPRYELEGIRWLRTDEEGNPLHRIVSDEMRLYADGSALVQTVVLDQLGGGNQWQLRAPYGDVPPGGEVLTLRDGVDLRGRWADDAPLEGHTDTLGIDTRTRELRTDDIVRLDGPGRSISGRGLRADWEGEQINLEHDVRLNYEQIR
jgi:LPS export ABC transporter protein LptC